MITMRQLRLLQCPKGQRKQLLLFQQSNFDFRISSVLVFRISLVFLVGPSFGSVNEHLRDFDHFDLWLFFLNFSNHFSLGRAKVESIAENVRAFAKFVIALEFWVSLNLKRYV